MSGAVRLRLVTADEERDERTPRRRKDPPKRWRGDDEVFFQPSQITVGTRILYFGRLDHGTTWRVSGITTHRWTKSNRLFGYNATVVRRSDDELLLVREGSNETRTMRYSYIEGSARWRLAE